MKKQFYAIALALLPLVGFGQKKQTETHSEQTHTIEKCSQHTRMSEMKMKDPERYATIIARQTENFEKTYSGLRAEKATGVIYTIPVVFHILHNGGTENISDAQIEDQLKILNMDFRKLNADANSVATPFQGMPTDVEIEFVFATKAPNGACFKGITRTLNAITSDGSDGELQSDAVIAGNDVYQGIWPHNKYLNIYVCKDLGGAAGYTFNPNGNSSATSSNMFYNGVFMLHDYTGSIGTSSVSHSRALTHEVGHWLNLSHVWGTNNNPGSAGCDATNDFVQDTPQTQGSTTCVLTANTCSGDNAYWGFNQVDNVENFMDYAYCSKMFTQGQVDRMRTAIVGTTGGRSNIWTTTNLNSVGGIPGNSLCALNFTASDVSLCTGEQINYTVNAGGAAITSYSWTFTGGTPSTSTQAAPAVTYNTPGTYQVALTVVSGGNSYTKTKTAYISVAGGTAVSVPLTEGFTSGTFPPTNWTVTNIADPGTWARTTAAGIAPSAGNSAIFDNYNIPAGNNDALNLPTINAASLGTLQMGFDVAYRLDSGYPSNMDGLEIKVSGDCGATFSTVYSKTGNSLATVAIANGQFVPTATQWRHETVDLNSFAGNQRVIVKMTNLSGYGNSLYIDNVNITGATTTANANFTVAPATVCVGKTVTYTNTSTGATSYNWNFGAGATPATATTAGPHTVTYSSAGSKTVTLQINGTGPTATKTVIVNANPTIPTITAGGSTTICTGESVTLTAPAGATSYAWSNGATTQSINATTAGSYTVTVTNASGCQSTSTATTITTKAKPASTTASSNSPICAGGTIQFTAGTQAGATYQWSGPSFTSTLKNPSIANCTVANSGTYELRTVVNGCMSDPTTITVVVNPTPSLPVITSNAPVCAGANLTMDGEVIAGASYSWTGPDGFTSTSRTNTINNVTSVKAGSYKLTITVSGCTSAQSSKVVVVKTIPTAPTASSNSPVCEGTPIVFTATNTLSGDYSWVGVSTFTSSLQNPIIAKATEANEGNYEVFITVNGCASPKTTVNVVVNPAPAVPVITSNSPVCTGQTLSLVTTLTPNVTYQWGGPASFATSGPIQSIPNVQLNNDGTYTLILTLNGCSSEMASHEVQVNETPQSAILSSNSPICSGSSLQLNAELTSNGSVSWSGPNFTSNEQNTERPNATVGMSGTYTVIVSNDGCASPASTISVVVNQTPIVNLSGTPTTGCVPLTVNFFGASGTGANQWSFGNGNTSTSNTVINQIYTTPGCFDVTLVITENGCVGSKTIQDLVCVDPCVGLDELSENTILVYPNPSNGNFTIDANESIIEQIQLIDNAGRLVSVISDLGVSKSDQHFQNLSNGHYTIVVTTAQRIERIPIVIQK